MHCFHQYATQRAVPATKKTSRKKSVTQEFAAGIPQAIITVLYFLAFAANPHVPAACRRNCGALRYAHVLMETRHNSDATTPRSWRSNNDVKLIHTHSCVVSCMAVSPLASLFFASFSFPLGVGASVCRLRCSVPACLLRLAASTVPCPRPAALHLILCRATFSYPLDFWCTLELTAVITVQPFTT